MENTQERLIRYLQDAHAAEVGVRKMLEGFVDDTDDQSIKMMFQEHLTITRTQEDRLEQCLRKYNAEPSDGKGFMNSLMAKIGDFIQGGHDQYDKNTQNLIKAYATEHLECAMYEALMTYAKGVGDQDVVQVAETIQNEEKETADRLWPMISKYATASLGIVGGENRAYPA
jgi:ferritin-like metal-binding protein YciE